MKLLKNAAGFAICYLLFLIPTYILPYLGSNSTVMQGIGIAGQAAGVQGSGGALINAMFFLHLGCLIALCVITWIRGSAEIIKWILAFPVLAAAFDLMPGLSLIPLVPTTFHTLALIFGMRGQPKVAIVENHTA